MPVFVWLDLQTDCASTIILMNMRRIAMSPQVGIAALMSMNALATPVQISQLAWTQRHFQPQVCQLTPTDVYVRPDMRMAHAIMLT